MDSQPASPVDPDADYLEVVARRRALSLSGEKRLAPDGLWLAVTENCNFRCVGCWREGVFHKTYLSLDELQRMLADDRNQSFGYISLTWGEAFLHPQLCDIIELCRAAHPDAVIDVISNGSIPPKGRFAKAISMIDDLGLSIDGCTRETFESIRLGGNFEKFIANTRETVEIRKATGNPADLTFCFTAITTNIAELPGVVDLAAELGVPSVYAQPMEMDHPEIVARVGEYDLSNMPMAEIYRITDAAVARGKTQGVQVDLAGFLQRPAAGKRGADGTAEAEETAPVDDRRLARDIRQCQYPYEKPFQYMRAGDKFHVQPCCYMNYDRPAMVAERYGLVFDTPPSVMDLYNSEGFWRFRTDLAEGKAMDLCGHCLQARTFPWRGGK